MKTRISTDLGDPRLMKLLKWDAQNTGSTVKDSLVRALEAYFAHQLQTKALQKASEEIFSEWSDVKDSDYDKL